MNYVLPELHFPGYTIRRCMPIRHASNLMRHSFWYCENKLHENGCKPYRTYSNSICPNRLENIESCHTVLPLLAQTYFDSSWSSTSGQS